MRLNLGCGRLPLEGYTNVDSHPDAPADIHGDIRELEFSDVEEVVSYHLLEHISHRETVQVLKRIRSWMKPGARITVEVPDMEAIMASPGPSWLTDVYGVQEHDGEYHKAGFNHNMLRHVLHEAGFTQIHSTCFLSQNTNRPGMPCIEATGRA